MDERTSLERAEQFLSELREDLKAAPVEFSSLIEPYAPRLEEAILRFQERRLPSRELDAHVFQIRISYARDLGRLLPSGPPPPTSRWVRAS